MSDPADALRRALARRYAAVWPFPTSPQPAAKPKNEEPTFLPQPRVYEGGEWVLRIEALRRGT